MSILNSDGLSLWVGDGLGTEGFAALRGAELFRFELNQRMLDSDAVAGDAWNIAVAAIERRAVVQGRALATDEAQAIRIRALALNGTAGNFRLNSNSADDFAFSAYVTSYKEVIQPGGIKQLEFTLESSGTVSVV